ncbi:hypothetical protein [Azospirillum endophyticum]
MTAVRPPKRRARPAISRKGFFGSLAMAFSHRPQKALRTKADQQQDDAVDQHATVAVAEKHRFGVEDFWAGLRQRFGET